MDGKRLLELAVELPDAVTEHNRGFITISLLHKNVVEKEATTKGEFTFDEASEFLAALAVVLADLYDAGQFDAAIANVASPGAAKPDTEFTVAAGAWERLDQFHGHPEHVRLFRIVLRCCERMIVRART